MSFLDDSTNIYNHETKTAESVTLAMRIETDEQDSFPAWLSHIMQVGDVHSTVKVFEILYMIWSCRNTLVFDNSLT